MNAVSLPGLGGVTALRPFFYFYGGKFTLSARLPEPRYPTIVEPFAGSAGYSVRFPDRNVILSDLDPIICGVWEYLIAATQREILALPLTVDTTVADLAIPQEARWLIGFWLNKGSATPKQSPSVWMREGGRPNTFWGENVRARLAMQVEMIRHWTIKNVDYRDVVSGDDEVTWYIDPPYSNQAGTRYRFSKIDYEHLAGWCRARRGQVIVSENEGASWLPFHNLHAQPSSRNRVSKEVVWTKAYTG